MRILVAIDAAETSERALAAVAPWAKAARADLFLLHVMHPNAARASATEIGELEPVPRGTQSGQMLNVTQPVPRLAEDHGQALARVRAETEDKLRALAARYLPDQACEVLVQSADDTAGAIVRAADGLPADLIVMGTHSRTGIRHALLGSVAESVIRQSKVPVLITGPNSKPPSNS